MNSRILPIVSRAAAPARVFCAAAILAAIAAAAPTQAAPRAKANDAAKDKRAPQGERWLLRVHELEDLSPAERNNYFLAMRQGFSEPLEATRKSAAVRRPSAFLEFLTAAFERANALGNVIGCQKFGYLQTPSECPSQGIPTHPEALNLSQSYFDNSNCRPTGQPVTTANRELPECGVMARARLSCDPRSVGSSGPTNTARICNPFVYSMQVGDGVSTRVVPPHVFCVDKDDLDLRCEVLADGRSIMVRNQNGFEYDYNIVENPAQERKLLADQLRLQWDLLQKNAVAYDKFVAEVERACSTDNLNNASLTTDSRKALAATCINLRMRIGRAQPKALGGLCDTRGTGLNMEAMCFACAIDATQRRIGDTGYTANRMWLAFLNTVPRFCPNGPQNFQSMLQKMGHCHGQPLLAVPDNRPDAQTLDKIAAGEFDRSSPDRAIEVMTKYYGFSFDILRSLACAERAGVTRTAAYGPVIEKMDAALRATAQDSAQVTDRVKAAAFLQCAREAILPTSSAANGASRFCGTTNRRRPLQPIDGPDLSIPEMTAPDPNYLTVVIPRRPAGQTTEPVCSVVMAPNAESPSETDPQWRVMNPTAPRGSTETLQVRSQSSFGVTGTSFISYRCDQTRIPEPTAPPAAPPRPAAR